jgi:hypothetical protein
MIIDKECIHCGTPVGVRVPDHCGADVVVLGPVCPDCQDAEVVAEGGRVCGTYPQPEGALFALGRLVVLPGAARLLDDAGLGVAPFLDRHARGDWGRFGRYKDTSVSAEEMRRGELATGDTAKLNKIGIVRGQGRVMSEYKTELGERILLDTIFGRGTNVLLPSEY